MMVHITSKTKAGNKERGGVEEPDQPKKQKRLATRIQDEREIKTT